jgi:transposase
MEMIGKIRRMYFRDKLSLHEITKRTGLARNTIRKWVRAPEAKQPVYPADSQQSKINLVCCSRNKFLNACTTLQMPFLPWRVPDERSGHYA